MVNDGGVGPGSFCDTDADCESGLLCAFDINSNCAPGLFRGLHPVLALRGWRDCQTLSDTNRSQVNVCFGANGCSATDAGMSGACMTNADCASGEVCVGGVCVQTSMDAGCASQPAVCNGTRTDLSSDPSNCGACGDVCATGELCSCGVCG